MSDRLDFTSNRFTSSHNLTLDLLLAVNVRADTVTMCCTNLSSFIPQKRTLSKVKFIQVGLSKVCQQSVSICCVIQRTDSVSVGQRRGDPQQDSHSQSSCWSHCRSSRNCPYCSRIPWQRRLATCHFSALHKERGWGRELGFTALFWWVNITKNQPKEETERSRRKMYKQDKKETGIKMFI